MPRPFGRIRNRFPMVHSLVEVAMPSTDDGEIGVGDRAARARATTGRGGAELMDQLFRRRDTNA